MKFLKISEKNINWSVFLGTLILIVLCSQLKIKGVNAGPGNTETGCVAKEGVNTFSLDVGCGSGKYRYMTFVCYDGFSKKEGSSTSCKTTSTWRSYAESYCKGHIKKCPTITATPTPYAVGATTANTIIPGSFLSLVSSKNIYSVGETFSVMVKVNSVGNKIDGVDSVINYNQSILSLISVTKSSLMVFNNSGDDCAVNPNFNSGKVIFTCYSSDSLNSKAVEGELIKLNFVAKSLGNSKINFECTKGSTLESNIVSNSVDIIDCAKNKNLSLNVNQPSGSLVASPSSDANAKCGHTRNTCAIGKANDEALSDTDKEYRWKCMSRNGGKNVNCALAKKTEGKCGSKKNTCVSGTVSVMSSSSSEYRWRCIGKNGGKMVSCSIKK